MSGWRLLPGYDTAPLRAQFGSLDAVFTLEGEVVSRDSLSSVLRVAADGRRFYIKRYSGLGKKPLRRWFGTPRVQVEWQNLEHFAAWGIATAPLVACGLEREGGRFVRGALITEEIPGTTDLGRIARSGDPRLKTLFQRGPTPASSASSEAAGPKSQSWRDGVCAQVADIARRMHSRRFAHGDLKWRNLLVDDAGKVYLIDCPSGGFWWPPFLEYRIVKDLACLDLTARGLLSRTRRLRFYLDYAGKQRLDAADKLRLRKILAFREDRDQETADSMRASGRRLQAPCTVLLEGGAELAVDQWLRILPGKRLTGIGRWNGEAVLAKLFVAARGAERHWQRECRGIALLAQSGLPTPGLRASGRLEEGGFFVLTQFFEDARGPAAGDAGELADVFETVGRMHALGILQEDVHLGNFLLAGGRLHVIDGDAVRPAGSGRAQLDNLALLFAQLPPDRCEALRGELLAAYRRGNPRLEVDEARLVPAIAQSRSARLAAYLDKCVRDCSRFKVARRTDRFFAMVRAESNFLLPLLADPDAWLEQGVPLKRGRSATLGLVDLEGRRLVIKRYNIKGPGHALSRAWRPSRAWHAWVEGHRLGFLGIPTPRPLMLVERRLGPLRGQAWLVTEHCEGPSLRTRLEAHVDSGLPEDMKAPIRRLFERLAASRIGHGDLKASNFLCRGDELAVLDLDAMRQYDGEGAWRKAWRKDRERFLRNWPEGSALRRDLDGVLPPA